MPNISVPPEGLPVLDFGGWEEKLTALADTLTAVVDQVDGNPLARLILSRTGFLPELDKAKALIDLVDAALHKLP